MPRFIKPIFHLSHIRWTMLLLKERTCWHTLFWKFHYCNSYVTNSDKKTATRIDLYFSGSIAKGSPNHMKVLLSCDIIGVLLTVVVSSREPRYVEVSHLVCNFTKEKKNLYCIFCFHSRLVYVVFGRFLTIQRPQ